MITMPIELYTDGSSLRNPGASGLAYVIRYWDMPEGSDLPEPKIIEKNQGFRLSTNNRMEIMAGVWGLRAIIQNVENGTFAGLKQINLFSDSEYFVKAVNMKWIDKWMQNNWMTSGFQGSKPKDVKNKDLWEQLVETRNKLQSMGIALTMTHVFGHNGNEFNERADNLAVEASKGTNHIIDEMYEKLTDVMNRR